MSINNAGNQRAKHNGIWGETVAREIIRTRFGEFTFIDDIVDFVSDSGQYIEIKTCESKIKSGDARYPFRTGRFILDKAQHTFLINNNGYYVFLVKDKDLLIRSLIVPANRVDYKRWLIWKRLFAELSVSGGHTGVETDGDNDTPKSTIASQTPAKRDFVNKTTGG